MENSKRPIHGGDRVGFGGNGEGGEGKTGFAVVVTEEDDGQSQVDQPEVRDGRCFKGNASSKFAKWK